MRVFFVQENHHRDVIYEVSTVEIESLSTISALIKWKQYMNKIKKQ